MFKARIEELVAVVETEQHSVSFVVTPEYGTTGVTVTPTRDASATSVGWDLPSITFDAIDRETDDEIKGKLRQTFSPSA